MRNGLNILFSLRSCTVLSALWGGLLVLAPSLLSPDHECRSSAFLLPVRIVWAGGKTAPWGESRDSAWYGDSLTHCCLNARLTGVQNQTGFPWSVITGTPRLGVADTFLLLFPEC